MSWDQGLQERDSLARHNPKFLAWADAQGEKRGWGKLEYITWFGLDQDTVFLDYGDNGSLKVDMRGVIE